MSRSAIRAVAKLRSKAAPILAERRRERERAGFEKWLDAWQVAARDHVIRVLTVFLKGDPKIDEPLHLAWRRVHEQFNLIHSIDKPVPTEFFYERIVEELP
jgi:hypothetical protein